MCNPQLDESQQRDITSLFEEYQEVLTDMPGLTTLGKHDIKLLNKEPIKSSESVPADYLNDNVTEAGQDVQVGFPQPQLVDTWTTGIVSAYPKVVQEASVEVGPNTLIDRAWRMATY